MPSYPWTLADLPSQIGKRVLITGANSGIGFAAARELARAGATILLACRDQARGRAAIERLRREAPAAPPPLLLALDLASLASVRAIAAQVVATGLPLDTLINNAGVFCPPQRKLTQEGFELQWGTNVLGHFALTCLLVPVLELAPAPRVVTVASIAHKRGRINFADLQSATRYVAMQAYAQSKLGDLMFALELQRRSAAAGLKLTSIAVHPGVAQTSLFKVGSGKGLAAIAEKLIAFGVGLTMNDDAQGALPTLFGATAVEAQGGGYYGPQGFQEMRGGDVGPAKIAPQALDATAQQQLWQACHEATGCDL